MSEHITHVAICDDCLRLMGRLPGISDAFRSVAVEHLDVARLGSVTRSTDRFNPQLLARIARGWEVRTPQERLEPKLAFSLGALCHRAADRTMKPIFARVAPEDPQDPKTVSIYHDVFLFREVYREGVEKPYSPTMFGASTEFEEHLRVLLQRALLGMHTFIPDCDHAEEWLDRLLATRQEFYVQIPRYAEVYHHPDPDKVRRYLTDARFYSAEDDLIRLARAIQRGGAVPEGAVAESLAADGEESEYARALRRGLRYLGTANRLFLGELTMDEARAEWEIGRPELAG